MKRTNSIFFSIFLFLTHSFSFGHNQFSEIQAGAYPVEVNYDFDVEILYRRGKYENKDISNTPFFSSRNFPNDKSKKGIQLVNIELLSFNENMNFQEIIQKMGEMGYRPADIKELLSFGIVYPNEQRKYEIVGLGSISASGTEDVAVLWNYPKDGWGKRYVVRYWFYYKPPYSAKHYFAAIRVNNKSIV